MNQIYKHNTYAQEAGSEVAMIKKLLQKIKFDVEISLEKGHGKIIGSYQINPLKYLLRECDKTSREI